MKVTKIALPVLAVAILFSTVACHRLDQMTIATADAGALPETTTILNKMRANHARIAANTLRHHRAQTGRAE